MAKSRLTWEWTDDGHSIVIRKAKGKLTLDEVFAFMQTREVRNCLEGCLLLWAFRSLERDESLDIWQGEDEGDTAVLQVVQDGDTCPVCGRHELFPQYCPDCGAPIKLPKEGTS